MQNGADNQSLLNCIYSVGTVSGPGICITKFCASKSEARRLKVYILQCCFKFAVEEDQSISALYENWVV